ncbi:7927_t:CDS:1, partial [Ambispora leptoticha]
MAILPEDCSCEVKEFGNAENNKLHAKHINNCLWREESEIKAFKDKMIEAILSKGGAKFKEYKNSIIQQIITQAQGQGISEAELNNNRPNWQNTLLSLNSPKEITDYRTNYLEKDIKNLVSAKSKSAQE